MPVPDITLPEKVEPELGLMIGTSCDVAADPTGDITEICILRTELIPAAAIDIDQVPSAAVSVGPEIKHFMLAMIPEEL